MGKVSFEREDKRPKPILVDALRGKERASLKSSRPIFEAMVGGLVSSVGDRVSSPSIRPIRKPSAFATIHAIPKCRFLGLSPSVTKHSSKSYRSNSCQDFYKKIIFSFLTEIFLLL